MNVTHSAGMVYDCLPKKGNCALISIRFYHFTSLHLQLKAKYVFTHLPAYLWMSIRNIYSGRSVELVVLTLMQPPLAWKVTLPICKRRHVTHTTVFILARCAQFKSLWENPHHTHSNNSFGKAEGTTAAILGLILRLVVAQGVVVQHHPTILRSMDVVCGV